MSPTWSERVAATRPVSPANLLCFHAWQFERAALQHIAVPLSLLVGCVLLALTSESAAQARMCATDACGALVGVLVRLRLRAHPDQERAQQQAQEQEEQEEQQSKRSQRRRRSKGSHSRKCNQPSGTERTLKY